ncbi:transcription elongation factor GreA [Candidatus Synchoanobacter obligatus]|uniref:Transcription elongation factor GreA n=1 Tax=Candidatus Synchoanobacter obligatus TaxID=2919597 RepID=A0ABT1L5X5_9GAMM|nr:transcription elongation factor GreA [Candidatus Synchoanobacter obligatus]MCP8352283.1 transcription elongation factor GreA [Candidatus Synchoanobacter obligatus]
MQKSPLTSTGEALLRGQLQTLKTSERQRLRHVLEEARAHGDLKENAEYHAAKEEQGLLEAKISYIESQLQSCTVIDTSKLNTDKAVFGAIVTLENIETEDKSTYQFVGEAETDMEQNKISYRSPVAQACIGQEVGDTVSVDTPSGQIEYEIMDIRYS